MERGHVPLSQCCQCSTASRAICVSCHRAFCSNHFQEHQQILQEQFDQSNGSQCLKQFQHDEEKFFIQIDQWESESIDHVRKTADKIRRSLRTQIGDQQTRFDEDLSNLRRVRPTTDRDDLLNRFERLIVDYQSSLTDIHLVKHQDRQPMLEIETKTPRRDSITTTNNSNLMVSQESDRYVAQTQVGKRLIEEPSAETSIGSYWAMGGSDQYLLAQEYEDQQLTLFDRQGNRTASMTWHYGLAIRDIGWHSILQRFLLLLDKTIFLFDPSTKLLEEILQIRPVQPHAFRRFTFNDNQLFISYWGFESIIELIRIDNWQSEQRWSSPVTCHANEAISTIRLNSFNQLALSIQDENNPLNRRFRVEIRDLTLNILHTLPIFIEGGILSRMISLPDRHWALLNSDGNSIFILNQRGELIDRIRSSHESLSNIGLISPETIVIRTNRKLLFYHVDF